MTKGILTEHHSMYETRKKHVYQGKDVTCTAFICYKRARNYIPEQFKLGDFRVDFS